MIQHLTHDFCASLFLNDLFLFRWCVLFVYVFGVMPFLTTNVNTAVSDDEAEVPSRNLIKRQALILVDSKARRKGFRVQPKRK